MSPEDYLQRPSDLAILDLPYDKDGDLGDQFEQAVHLTELAFTSASVVVVIWESFPAIDLLFWAKQDYDLVDFRYLTGLDGYKTVLVFGGKRLPDTFGLSIARLSPTPSAIYESLVYFYTDPRQTVVFPCCGNVNVPSRNIISREGLSCLQ